MATPAAMVRQRELDRIFAAAKKAGLHVRVEAEPGRLIVTTVAEGASTGGVRNGFDDAV